MDQASIAERNEFCIFNLKVLTYSFSCVGRCVQFLLWRSLSRSLFFGDLCFVSDSGISCSCLLHGLQTGSFSLLFSGLVPTRFNSKNIQERNNFMKQYLKFQNFTIDDISIPHSLPCSPSMAHLGMVTKSHNPKV